MRKIDHAAHAFVLPISIDLREEFVFGFRQIEHVARKWLIFLVPQSHRRRQHIGHGVTKGTAAKTVTQEKPARQGKRKLDQASIKQRKCEGQAVSRRFAPSLPRVR